MKFQSKLLLIILILAIIPVIIITLSFNIMSHNTLGRQIEKTHYDKVASVDSLISTIISDMINIGFSTRSKFATLIEAKNYKAIKENLNIIDQIDSPELGTGRGLGYNILIVTNNDGDILARSNITVIKGEKVNIDIVQDGHIMEGWTPSTGFKDSFERARQGEIDARKIIYNKDFIKREGYQHLVERYGYREMMGLTAQIPILNQKQEQVGILIIITSLNNNYTAIGAIDAITGSSFTAFTPSGEVIASSFVNPPIPNKEIIEKAKERAYKMKQGLRDIAGKESVFYTEERIYLKGCHGIVIIKNGVGMCHYKGQVIPHKELQEKAYRFHFIAEVDQDFNFVAIRGVAYELTEYDLFLGVQGRYFGIIFAIAFSIISIISLFVSRRIAYPILKFTEKIQEIGKVGIGKKIEIKTGDEIEVLVNAFNDMNQKIIKNYETIEEQNSVLEIKITARTRELRELASSLEDQVKERTEKLQLRIKELERFHRLTVGREIRMIELKKEIDKLKKQIKNLKKGL